MKPLGFCDFYVYIILKMRYKLTDDEIRRFFWKYDESPYSNKATYLLGDLSEYGVSRCRKFTKKNGCVWYEFDIYSENDSIITLVVELPLDFVLRDVTNAMKNIKESGGMIASTNMASFYKWDKQINPRYHYEHARYCAMNFLEALRKRLSRKRKTGSGLES